MTSTEPPGATEPVNPLIHRAVAAQARLRPGATAIFFREERIDYRTLDAAAEHLAGQLAAHGVGPGTVVPVRMPRTPQLVAVLLAVLKCGAAYAALDHRWPAERIDGLLEQLRPPVFVSADDHPGSPATAPARWQPPTDPLPAVAALGGSAPEVELDPAAPASVFFTSGTTGTPKGVVSPHRATTRLFGPGGLRGYGPQGVTTQAAPCPWDAFSLEVWGMLTTGGAIVVVEEDYLLPGALRDVVKSAGVDTVFLTTTLFNLFVDMDPDCFLGTRQVFTGGERNSTDHIGRFLARHPGIALFHVYGPVESCVYATEHRIRPADCETPGGVPIGRAVAGTGVHVLDGERVCAPGEEGEICVSGDGLAVGYLGLPELTAQKFPEVTVAGERLRVYRTGDLGFVDAEGALHFRGRADRQVKVRGHRIEPGEIETAATRIEGVRRCTVVPVPGRTTAWERLALFYTADPLDPSAADAADPVGVTAELGRVLPPYLVPDAVLAVPDFPLTANGKIDNAALLGLLPPA
ncbi:amino acid adenylation domain-containing protein [Kitasatospora viridis]|uniref:Amino acid adenylation domain-containing protein n=1 Tax=Kitasatospora viridis TaxID=281105 RepID=A0A561UJU2_9ACTN|nr:amino acid adenylation domain-containing protein [Kitasatospora viridis]TWF99627.1 amino acid adenylation domain-containing protein [Kitasatospora viridis]